MTADENEPETSQPRRERGLTRKQIERLTKAISPNHVEKKQGLSYMAQHEVRAELTRIFGYGNWDSQVEEMEFLWEERIDPGTPGHGEKWKKIPYYRVCYRARVRLNIRDYWGNPVCSFVEEHVEANSALPDRGEAYAMAVTSVESYALRRAAIGLGDRLGLGLYDGGNTGALVKGTLQTTDPESPLHVPPRTAADAPAPASMERLQAATNVKE